MAFQKLDKKQVPQVAALAVLACGVVGYGAKQIFVPVPASARTAAAAPAAADKAAAPAQTAPPAPNNGGAGLVDSAPPPAAGMRDPFQQTISDRPSLAGPMAPPPAAPKTASLVVPHAPALPMAPFGMAGVRPLPAVSGVSVPAAPPLPIGAGMTAPPAAPTWTVTGVLASGVEHIAILRSGTERRFVRQGEWADSQFQVVRVSRDSVTLKHGAALYTLPLGGKDASPTPQFGGAKLVPTPPELGVGGPSAVSTRPAVQKTFAPPVLASMPYDFVPHLWKAKTAPRAALVSTASTFHLALQTPILAAIMPIIKPVVKTKPVVKVAAYHAKSMVKTPAVPHGMLALGTQAPDFTLRTLSGQAVSLSQMLAPGRPTVVTFWASWVAPCAAALPQMAQIAQSTGAAFLPVGTWDSRAALLSFAAAHSLDARTVLCDEAVPNNSVAVRLYHSPDVPTCYVLDGRGRVAAAFVGFNSQTAAAVRATLIRLKTL